MLNHVHEWDIMMTTGELFPDLEPQAIRKIAAPTLLLFREKSYRFLALIDEETRATASSQPPDHSSRGHTPHVV